MSPAGLILIGFGISNGSWGMVFFGFALLVLDFMDEIAEAMHKRQARKPPPEPELPWFQQDKPMYPICDEDYLSWERCLVLEYMQDQLLWYHLEDELWRHLQDMRTRQIRSQWEKRPAAPVKVKRK